MDLHHRSLSSLMLCVNSFVTSVTALRLFVLKARMVSMLRFLAQSLHNLGVATLEEMRENEHFDGRSSPDGERDARRA